MMSKTLVCLQEPLPFYTQESASGMCYGYDDGSIKGSSQKPLCANFVPQDENACLDTQVPRIFSRKREATNILMECVKRRDNLRNIDAELVFNVSSGDSSKEYVTTHPVGPNMEPRITNNSNSAVEKMDFSDTSSTDSGLGQSPKVSSPCSDADDVSRTELCSEDQGAKLDLVETGVLPNSSSPAISEDLGCLHLTDEGKSPFIPSLFPRVARILYFPAKDEKVGALPDEILTRMKWKLSTITPVLIREMLLKIGFKLLEADTKENWVGTWGKHLKCAMFKEIKHFQKVNHYPGSFHLGRKDKLWSNLRRLRERHGSGAFNFFPETFLLPENMKALKNVWDSETEKCWIIKPPASARGTGVKVICKWSQVPKNKPIVVQRYLSDPYLIDGTKFDLRIYVLIPSMEPLRIYVFEDGLVRFASQKYSLSDKSFRNRFVHLTNYSINRKSSSYTYNEDENSCQGHKWTLKAFWTYMANCGINIDKIKDSIVEMIIKTVICSEMPMMRLIRTYEQSTYNCFELFGFDIMLDKNLRPWLLEVNISPSLHTRSMLDSSVKGQLMRDVFNLVGFQVPEDSQNLSEQKEYGITSMVANRFKSLKHRSLTAGEKKKHSYHTFEYPNQELDILESLTPDDVRCLIESEDEFHRRGAFMRIFPTSDTSRYFPYFEHTRYYNLLLDAWEKKFHDKRLEGVKQLQSLCREGYHLRRYVPEGYFSFHADSATENA